MKVFFVVLDDSQSLCDDLSMWCDRWRLIVNTDLGKSEVVPHNFNAHTNLYPKLIVQDKELEYVDCSPVLGVNLDSKLTWNKHNSVVLSRCWSKWKTVKKYASSQRGFKASTILIIARSFILPIILYCSPVWLHGLEGNFKSLFYDIIKSSLGVPYNPEEMSCQFLANMPPLNIINRIISTRFLLKNYCSTGQNYRNDICEFLSPVHPFWNLFNDMKKFISSKNSYGRSHRLIDLQSPDFDNESLFKYSKREMNDYAIDIWNEVLRSSQSFNDYTCHLIKAPTPFSSLFNSFTRNIERIAHAIVLNGKGFFLFKNLF